MQSCIVIYMLKHFCFNFVNPQQITIGRITKMLTDQQCFRIVQLMVSVMLLAISSGAFYIFSI